MKRIVELIRVEQDDKATIGVLLVDGKVVCWTLEEPWRQNQVDVSCIPIGRYPMMLEFSPSKRKELWTIKDVPGRSYVRIHTGNTVLDTEGCPLTGSKLGYLSGKRAVLGSGEAFKAFMASLDGAETVDIVVRKVA